MAYMAFLFRIYNNLSNEREPTDPKGPTMNRAKLISAIALGVVAVGVTLKDYVKIRKVEMETREKILADAEETIRVIHLASDKISDRIVRGDYDRKTYQDVVIDYEFEKIIEANKDM